MRAFTFIIILLSVRSFAQNVPLPLEASINIALKNNLGIRSSGLEVASQAALKGTAFSIPKTDINLLYGQYNSGSSDNNVTVLQTIPFTALGSQGKLNRTQLESIKLKQIVTRNDVVFSVKQAYYLLLYALERKRLLQSQDSLYQGFLRSASARYRSGEGNLLEKTTAESQRDEARNKLFKVESEIKILQTELKTILSSDTLPDASHERLKPIHIDITSDSLNSERNPGLAYSRSQIQVAAQERKFQEAKAAPDLVVGYFNQTLIGTPRDNGTIAGKGERFSGFQVGVALPLWFAPNVGRIKAAALNKQVAENNYESYRASLHGKFQQAFEQYQTDRSSLEYFTNAALPNAELILRQADIAFRSGEVTYAEFLLALKSGLGIKENHLQTLNEYNQSIIYLEYLTGNIE